MRIDKKTLAEYIDHTNLKPTATETDIRQVCAEARQYGFASVCVNPVYTALVAQELEGSDVMTCCVVGFPLGANDSRIKAMEASQAVEDGADELDMVIDIGALKGGNRVKVQSDIAAVVEAAAGRTVKVIIETCYLSDEEKKIACQCARDAGAHFVKTSTGFGSGGATVEDVKLMRQVVGDDLKVKASGGVRSLDDALAMIEAGADRIGASAGIKIVDAL
ncbi:MAG TPA: deoxyribose-phosphate aldolase [Sediminispirochaeta sp.]|nr:deoxyribose-phosphate aldolase [Sediminispirochaeta sp.]